MVLVLLRQTRLHKKLKRVWIYLFALRVFQIVHWEMANEYKPHHNGIEKQHEVYAKNHTEDKMGREEQKEDCLSS